MPSKQSVPRIWSAEYATMFVFSFFQAEDGIRDLTVTGVQTCALPISLIVHARFDQSLTEGIKAGMDDEGLAWHLTDQLVRRAQEVFLPVWQQTRGDDGYVKIGRASCRERV